MIAIRRVHLGDRMVHAVEAPEPAPLVLGAVHPLVKEVVEGRDAEHGDCAARRPGPEVGRGRQRRQVEEGDWLVLRRGFCTGLELLLRGLLFVAFCLLHKEQKVFPGLYVAPEKPLVCDRQSTFFYDFIS